MALATRFSVDSTQTQDKVSGHDTPAYVIDGRADGIDIIFNLFGGVRSQLHAFLASDRSRLHVTAQKDFHDTVETYLWIFNLPTSVDTDNITVDRKADVYVLHIPKRRPQRPSVSQALPNPYFRDMKVSSTWGQVVDTQR